MRFAWCCLLLPLRAQDAADLDIDLANPWATHQPPAAPVVDTWSQLFNRRFAAAGLAPVAVDLAATLPFDGLYAATGPGVDGPLVTVIVPSYAPDAGLINSIRSLAAQTYGNLEILLVDDASGPAYSARYDEALALDPRVRLLRMPVNGGSYVGRNEALASARGRFITTCPQPGTATISATQPRPDHEIARSASSPTIAITGVSITPPIRLIHTR